MTPSLDVEPYARLAAKNIGLSDPSVADVALMSIAISMRRIADEIKGDKDHLGLVNGVMNAIESGIIQGANR